MPGTESTIVLFRRCWTCNRLSKNAAENNYDIVVAVGGDGSVNEVAKGLLGSSTSLGIIPAGSGNGLARHLKIPFNPHNALESNRSREWYTDRYSEGK